MFSYALDLSRSGLVRLKTDQSNFIRQYLKTYDVYVNAHKGNLVREYFTGRTKFILKLLIFYILIGLTACQHKTNYKFNFVSPTHSGIHFSNTITENDSINILDFHYIYNGGGVGVGDFNKDGLPDLCFSGNQVASKLYINKGNLQFEDITEQANFDSKGWTTGVAIADINADGWLDIYLSVGGKVCNGHCINQLFIHQGLDDKGIPVFKESAAKYGLTDGLYTQQAAFFDYDLDGDLDVYLLHNIVDPKDKNSPSPHHYINENTQDKLLRNDVVKDKSHPVFTDISEEAGINKRGYGLGIAIEDFNQDNYPDIYIANDFLSEDLLYLNKGKKAGKHQGFKETAKQYLAHQTYNSMGVDIADVNQDALPDIMVVDMLPAYYEREKRMQGFMNYDKFLLSQKQNYSAQFMRNTLQINNGFTNNNLLRFSDLGYMTAVYKTDWSWTPLLADFDNDGDRDIYITNGYVRDITDLDFVNYSAYGTSFGTKEAHRAALQKAINEMEGVKLNNYFYENNTLSGQLSPQTKDQSAEWIRATPSYSNGAAYTDLDNDGDLDLIVNNINDKAFLLENTSDNNNYLKIQLKGSPKNPNGIGTKIYTWCEDQRQYYFHSPQRGYLSSMDNTIHFGLGSCKLLDSLKIVWSTGIQQTLYNLNSHQLLSLNIEEAKTKNISKNIRPFSPFKKIQSTDLINYQHRENVFHDYYIQHLLLHQYAQDGPCIAVANIDNKSGEELFIGGAKGFSGQIFFQESNGKYKATASFDAKYEDTDAIFFDADNDGDKDLYVVSGGSEFKANNEAYQDRIYTNDGKGNFEYDTSLLPEIRTSGATVVHTDFDKDGDEDLFIGGRVTPHRFPEIPRSYLLENQQGKFVDITPENLQYPGMLTDAIWQDYNNDGWQDLILLGEWMPVLFFKNDQGKLENEQVTIQHPSGEKATIDGLWNCIAAKDIDQDGDIDFVLGNQGMNTRLKGSAKEPLYLYTADHDNNGSPDPLIAQYYTNKAGKRLLYPLHTRDDVMKQLVKLKTTYQDYKSFSEVDFNTLLKPKQENLVQVNQLHSAYLENKNNGEFIFHELPPVCQWSSVNTILIDDFDQDGRQDILLAGNDYSTESNGGWQDAMTGVLLQGDGKGNFKALRSASSGFYAPGHVRALNILKDKKGEKYVLAGQNSDTLSVFAITK